MVQVAYYSHGAPSTSYYMYADLISQNQAGNYSTIRLTIRAYNSGNTSSYSGYWGEHYGYISGVSGSAYYSDNPFLRSGYANGALRWERTADINVGHDANGYLGALYFVEVINSSDSGLSGSNGNWVNLNIPRIPKRPSAPGTPSFSNVLPQSVTVSWTGSADNGGSSIDGYLLRYWPNATGTGAYTDSYENNTSRTISGLTPGQEYYFLVYAKNSSADNGGYSNQSSSGIVRMLSGARIKIAGIWKLAIPYVKVGGVWKLAMPFIKVSGIWKKTG